MKYFKWLSWIAMVSLLLAFDTGCELVGNSQMIDGGHSHHQGSVVIDGMVVHNEFPEKVKTGEQVKLVVHLEKDGKPLEKTKVQFETWMSDEKRIFVDAEESVKGEYTAMTSFSEPGTYQIQTHIEGVDLHEHAKSTIQVE